MGTCSPFTRRVVDYCLPEKLKVPHILSYIGDGDPLDHLENFRVHIDLHETLDEIACRAFPLLFWGMPGTGLGSCPQILLINSRSCPNYS